MIRNLFRYLLACCFVALLVCGVSIGITVNDYTDMILKPLPSSSNGTYTLPYLPYQTYELEPYIDNATVVVHYTGHHRAYTNNLNNVLKNWRATDTSGLSNQSLAMILANLIQVPTTYRQSFVNQAGGYLNHLLYWYSMSPNPQNNSRQPDLNSKLYKDIIFAFGSYSNFSSQFTAAATSLFGSGYVWLVRHSDTLPLSILSTPNQETVFQQATCAAPNNKICVPIITIDVWEHAYYLKNKNLRGNYIGYWWQLVDWGNAAQLDQIFSSATVPHMSESTIFDHRSPLL